MDEAQFALGFCYQHGYGSGEPDLAQAQQWYRKAAEQGHRRAKNALRRLDQEEALENTLESEEKDASTQQTVSEMVYGPAHPSFRCKGIDMSSKAQMQTFVEQVKQQILCLKDEEYNYSSLHVYIAGVPEPWELSADDDFELQEETGVLIVRDGPTDEENNDNAEVPEYVFRLDAITATQLVCDE